MSDLQTLLEMGFSENSSKKALSVTGGGVEAAMEWLLAHSDDPGINDPPAPAPVAATPTTQAPPPATPTQEDAKPDDNAPEKMETDPPEGSSGPSETTEGQESSESKQEEEEAKSIKCDDCGKLFRTSEEVEFHAVKSGHSNFSESTEEKKPLTEEEKQEKKKQLEEKIKLRRKAREQEEEKEAREREKKRIQTGQEIAERKRTMQEMEMKRIAEERKKEKLEDKMARERVKEQIERDKQARKEMFANNKGDGAAAGGTSSVTKATPTPTPPAATSVPVQKKEYSTARLQIRLPTGTPMVKEFQAKEALSAVRLWISLNREDGESVDAPINLSMSFPRKMFSDEDMDKPLDALGLVPSAVLMVSK